MGVPCLEANTSPSSRYREPAARFSSSWRLRWLLRALTAHWGSPTVRRLAFLGNPRSISCILGFASLISEQVPYAPTR